MCAIVGNVFHVVRLWDGVAYICPHLPTCHLISYNTASPKTTQVHSLEGPGAAAVV